MDFTLHPSTLLIMSSVAAFASVVTAWCLSNHRTGEGRLLGILASSIWGGYGILTEQYPVVITQFTFIIIYTQAWLKFKRKRDSYRIKFHKQEDLIEHQAKTIELLRRQLQTVHKTLNKVDYGELNDELNDSENHGVP